MKKIPTFSKKQLILSLIKDDLIHSHLIYGFESMQIDASDYTLHLSRTVFSLAGIKPDHKKINEILENYIDLTRKVKKINVVSSAAKLDALAEKIYSYLRVAGKQKTINS